MALGKERSSLFKFLYTVLRVITFPIYTVLYVLKHPLWVTFLLFVLCGVAVYYPLQSGVKLEDVPEWYRKKYTEVKYEVVAKSIENGDTMLFSQEMLENLADEVAADNGLKSENYNAKVSRNKAIDEVASSLKKRGGFKRKGNVSTQTENVEEGGTLSENTEEQTLPDVSNVTAGGLEVLLGNTAKEEVLPISESAEESVVLESKPVLPQPSADVQLVPSQNLGNELEDEFDLF